MAKITVFECDICKAQSKKINLLKLEIATILLSNEDNKPTVGTPTISHCDVCSDKCAMVALSRMLRVDMIEGGEASNGKTGDHFQLTSDNMRS